MELGSAGGEAIRSSWARAARAAWRCASARDTEVFLDDRCTFRRVENGAGGDLGIARRQERHIEPRDDDVGEGV